MDWLEYHEEPVSLHSGGWSHWLVRADLMFEDERIRNAVLECWTELLSGWRTALHVVGIPTGGDKWAEALRASLPNPVGANTIIVLVDDVVTTGASISQDAHVRLAVVDRRVDYKSFMNPPVFSWATMRLPICYEPE